MHLKEHNIVIPIDSGPSNLPMTWNPSVSAKEQKGIALNFVSKLACCDAPGLTSLTMKTFDYISYDEIWKDSVCPCVGIDENQNLSGPQKELLTWHWKLGIGMQQIQEMMQKTKLLILVGEN